MSGDRGRSPVRWMVECLCGQVLPDSSGRGQQHCGNCRRVWAAPYIASANLQLQFPRVLENVRDVARDPYEIRTAAASLRLILEIADRALAPNEGREPDDGYLAALAAERAAERAMSGKIEEWTSRAHVEEEKAKGTNDPR